MANHELYVQKDDHETSFDGIWKEHIPTGGGWAWCACGWGASPDDAAPVADYEEQSTVHAREIGLM